MSRTISHNVISIRGNAQNEPSSAKFLRTFLPSGKLSVNEMALFTFIGVIFFCLGIIYERGTLDPAALKAAIKPAHPVYGRFGRFN